MSPFVTLERDGAIAVITLNKPDKRNAFCPEMRRAAAAHLRALATDAQCRAVVLTGTGGNFCAGADLSRVDQNAPPQTALETRQNMQEVHELIRLLFAGPKPVIAAVEGLAFGGGFSIALACDQIVASRTARFGTAFAKLGLIGDMGIAYTLKARVGLTTARRMLALGTQLDAEEALKLGVADTLTEPGQALAAALDIARSYAASAPLTIAYTKATYGNGIETIEDAFRAELDYLPIVIHSADFQNALAAFKEKRPPIFDGS